ncbi:hypothetical protein YC2023_024792 [Brassica napus]
MSCIFTSCSDSSSINNLIITKSAIISYPCISAISLSSSSITPSAIQQSTRSCLFISQLFGNRAQYKKHDLIFSPGRLSYANFKM